MAVAPFISRGVLSVSNLLFFAVALLHRNFFKQLKQFAATPFLWVSSLLFFLPAVSGLWSQDAERWSDVMRIKLPLLFFPLAFAGDWALTKKQWQWIAAVFLTGVAGGCVWGLAGYAQNAAQVHESYLRAKTILTPLEDDHVRFSWLAAVAVILSLLLAQTEAQKKRKVLWVALAVFFVLYLHVLSARTGLLSLYLFLAVYAGWFFLKKKNTRQGALLLFLFLALPFAAYLVLPTFRARIRYVVYDLSFVRKSAYLPGSSDGARTLSLKAGWQVLKENPLGVGAGDLRHEADKWYAAHVPNVLPDDKIQPSSEWLLYGGFAGWIGVVLFTVIMLLPFFAREIEHKIFWAGFHATAAFSFLFDMGLEVQYGVFLYAALSGCLWKALERRQSAIANRQS